MLEPLRAHLGRNVAPPRFLLFAAVLVVGSGGAGWATGAWNLSLLIGFDVAAWVFLLSLWPLLDDDAVTMRRAAKVNDANRVALLALTVLLSTIVLIAVGTLIASRQGLKWQGLALIVGTLVSSWLFANTVFALHYAHLYYLPASKGNRGDRGGLDFPQDGHPDYWDFLYFSFTLGMTFQTSDVAIKAPHLRRVVLGHSMAAFVFNMGVLAFTVNALGGM